jgi:Ribbon-helix-helix protein, copG family
MPSQSTATEKPPGLKSLKSKGRFVRLSVNLSFETAEIFRKLIERKGLSISEGIRRAIAVWNFLEDEKSRGNEIAVVEPDETVRKVVLL